MPRITDLFYYFYNTLCKFYVYVFYPTDGRTLKWFCLVLQTIGTSAETHKSGYLKVAKACETRGGQKGIAALSARKPCIVTCI